MWSLFRESRCLWLGPCDSEFLGVFNCPVDVLLDLVFVLGFSLFIGSLDLFRALDFALGFGLLLGLCLWLWTFHWTLSWALDFVLGIGLFIGLCVGLWTFHWTLS